MSYKIQKKPIPKNRAWALMPDFPFRETRHDVVIDGIKTSVKVPNKECEYFFRVAYDLMFSGLDMSEITTSKQTGIQSVYFLSDVIKDSVIENLQEMPILMQNYVEHQLYQSQLQVEKGKRLLKKARNKKKIRKQMRNAEDRIDNYGKLLDYLRNCDLNARYMLVKVR